jgi:acyl CoA:acetate/3-ketoacid CoA transferase alpha subunit
VVRASRLFLHPRELVSNSPKYSMRVCIDVVNIDTLLQTGEIPVRLGPVDKSTGKMTVLEAGKPRETRIFDGKIYGMETAIKADVAILRAWKVDEAGNCQFRYMKFPPHLKVMW